MFFLKGLCGFSVEFPMERLVGLVRFPLNKRQNLRFELLGVGATEIHIMLNA